MDCTTIQNAYSHCAECSSKPQIVIGENKRQYRLNNETHRLVCVVEIDGCVLTSQTTKKCDYLITVCHSNTTYFVELKGKHLIEGVEQITQTLNEFENKFGYSLGELVFARIVLSRGSEVKATANDGRVKNLRKRLKKWKGDLDYHVGTYDKDSVERPFTKP